MLEDTNSLDAAQLKIKSSLMYRQPRPETRIFQLLLRRITPVHLDETI